MVREIDLLAKADGLRVVLQALSDGPPELAPSLAMVFLFVIDRPHLRAYLRPGVDLEVALSHLLKIRLMIEQIALSGLTEGGSASKILAQSDKMRSSGRIAVMLLKTWSGQSISAYSMIAFKDHAQASCIYVSKRSVL